MRLKERLRVANPVIDFRQRACCLQMSAPRPSSAAHVTCYQAAFLSLPGAWRIIGLELAQAHNSHADRWLRAVTKGWSSACRHDKPMTGGHFKVPANVRHHCRYMSTRCSINAAFVRFRLTMLAHEILAEKSLAQTCMCSDPAHNDMPLDEREASFYSVEACLVCSQR